MRNNIAQKRKCLEPMFYQDGDGVIEEYQEIAEKSEKDYEP